MKKISKLASVAALVLATVSAPVVIASPAVAGDYSCGCSHEPGPGKHHKKGKGNNGFGNGGKDGSPNGKQDWSR